MSVDALYETVFAHPGPWTEDDYFALPEMPTKVELVDGVLVVNPLSNAVHQRLTRSLGIVIENACPNRDWEVFDGLNVRLWLGHVRNPDIVVARRGATALSVPATEMLLLAEITSPGNFRQDRIAKHGDYAAASIPFYLRVDLENGPDAVEATLFELSDGEYREAVRSVDGVLRSSLPWPFEADLRALATDGI